MTNINAKLKKILNDLEERIENKEDLEFVKLQMFNLYNALFEEMNKQEEIINKKISSILEIQSQMEGKVEKIENELNEIQKDIYAEDDSEFAIVCPYCNHEFVLELDVLKEEVECPECNNIIELDWGNETEDEEHGCGGCGCSDCHHHDEDDM